MLHCLSNIPFTFSAYKIYCNLRSHPFHSDISTKDPLTTVYTQNWVSLYSQAVDPKWVNVTFTYLVFWRLTSKPLLSKASFHFKNLFLSPSIVLVMKNISVQLAEFCQVEQTLCQMHVIISQFVLVKFATNNDHVPNNITANLYRYHRRW